MVGATVVSLVGLTVLLVFATGVSVGTSEVFSSGLTVGPAVVLLVVGVLVVGVLVVGVLVVGVLVGMLVVGVLVVGVLVGELVVGELVGEAVTFGISITTACTFCDKKLCSKSPSSTESLIVVSKETRSEGSGPVKVKTTRVHLVPSLLTMSYFSQFTFFVFAVIVTTSGS